jgi:hypothetical protein
MCASAKATGYIEDTNEAIKIIIKAVVISNNDSGINKTNLKSKALMSLKLMLAADINALAPYLSTTLPPLLHDKGIALECISAVSMLSYSNVSPAKAQVIKALGTLPMI